VINVVSERLIISHFFTSKCGAVRRLRGGCQVALLLPLGNLKSVKDIYDFKSLSSFSNGFRLHLSYPSEDQEKSMYEIKVSIFNQVPSKFDKEANLRIFVELLKLKARSLLRI
jgi:hypothetical protein